MRISATFYAITLGMALSQPVFALRVENLDDAQKRRIALAVLEVNDRYPARVRDLIENVIATGVIGASDDHPKYNFSFTLDTPNDFDNSRVLVEVDASTVSAKFKKKQLDFDSVVTGISQEKTGRIRFFRVEEYPSLTIGRLSAKSARLIADEILNRIEQMPADKRAEVLGHALEEHTEFRAAAKSSFNVGSGALGLKAISELLRYGVQTGEFRRNLREVRRVMEPSEDRFKVWALFGPEEAHKLTGQDFVGVYRNEEHLQVPSNQVVIIFDISNMKYYEKGGQIDMPKTIESLRVDPKKGAIVTFYPSHPKARPNKDEALLP